MAELKNQVNHSGRGGTAGRSGVVVAMNGPGCGVREQQWGGMGEAAGTRFVAMATG